MNEGEALDWVIRGCACLRGAEGQAAGVLHEAYGRGLLGLGENRRAHEQYVRGRRSCVGPGEMAALEGLLRLRSYAYGLGLHDACLLEGGLGVRKEELS